VVGYRVEKDSLGEVLVPENAYYGAQTQRAVENFRISGWTMPRPLIHALGLVKYACAVVNRDLGRFSTATARPLDESQIAALLEACMEVARGRWDDQFPVDVFQTGSGTSTNMNANEVIARRAMQILQEKGIGAAGEIHPNDHVNLGQSSNDVFPTATHVAVVLQITGSLQPALAALHSALQAKAQQWHDILKIGRTHLMDATPIRLGQEIGGLARQVELGQRRLLLATEALKELPIGGTAVGTGLNTHPEFGRRVAEELTRQTGVVFVEAANHFEANAARDALVECHGQLRTVAVSLFHIANAIRFMASGPRCGLNEVRLPSLQPGSSIMPGKVNPVLCESLMQVAARVLGNDQTISFLWSGWRKLPTACHDASYGSCHTGERRVAGGRLPGIHPVVRGGYGGERGGVCRGSRKKSRFGYEPRPAHRLRRRGASGPGSPPFRKNHPPNLLRTSRSARNGTRHCSGPVQDDRARLASQQSAQVDCGTALHGPACQNGSLAPLIAHRQDAEALETACQIV